MVNPKTLSELSALASQLNSETDGLNASIEALNKQLNAMNIGIDYWLSDPLKSTGLRQNSKFSPPLRYERDTYLGYHKVDERWQLAIKKEYVEYRWSPEENQEYPVKEVSFISLLKTSRDNRLLAVEQFDDLLEKLKKHIEAKLSAIRQAEQLAKPK